MHSKLTFVFKYSFFAFIATAINLGMQFISFRCYQGVYDIYLAMFLGTGTGLVTKYILDKLFIFYYQVQSKKEGLKKFILYTVMGIITTVIFWGFELTFNSVFSFDSAKYLGAMIGLTIGYITKYFLDKKFVFVKK